MYAQGQGVCRKPLYLPVSSAVNLKHLLKKNSKKQKWMIAKTESLIKIIKSIVPTEIWKGCNRFVYEWKSRMMLTLVIKLPEWMLRQSQSESSLYKLSLQQ